MKKTERKKARRAEAAKRNKKKKILAAAVSAAVIAIITVLLILNTNRHDNTNRQRDARVFTDGSQAVTLYNDGTFAARLSHNNRKDGTYTETTEDSVTVITFSYGGTIVDARVVNNIFTIPGEWDDHHGHNRRLQLR